MSAPAKNATKKPTRICGCPETKTGHHCMRVTTNELFCNMHKHLDHKYTEDNNESDAPEAGGAAPERSTTPPPKPKTAKVAPGAPARKPRSKKNPETEVALEGGAAAGAAAAIRQAAYTAHPEESDGDDA